MRFRSHKSKIIFERRGWSDNFTGFRVVVEGYLSGVERAVWHVRRHCNSYRDHSLGVSYLSEIAQRKDVIE